PRYPKEVRMAFKVALLLLIFLGPVLAQTNESRHLVFLNKLVQKFEQLFVVNTLVIFRHHGDNSCLLQNWNHPSTPILRGTEDSHFWILGNFNHLALAFVCIRNESDVGLLGNLMEAFDTIYEGRAVLWVQAKLTEKLKTEIVKKMSKVQIHPILILEICQKVAVYRFEMFREPTFIRLKNVLRNKKPLFMPKLSFYGMTTEHADLDFPNHVNQYYNNKSMDITPKFGTNGQEIVEFTQRYNTTMKIDGRINISFSNSNYLASLGFVNPYRSFSLIVVVPCGTEMSLKDIFKHLDFQSFLAFILTVYGILIIAETVIRVLTYRLHGVGSGLGWITPRTVVNLRVFRSILGMSFPIGRRTSLPLRQLFLAMSVFGMVFSTFFGCKLTSLMTKHTRIGQVTNLEELRSSGLTIVVNPRIRKFIETKIDPYFFTKIPGDTIYVPMEERIKMINSLKTKFGHVMFGETFYQINKVQLLIGRKEVCTSKDLVIAENMPRIFFMENKSYAKWLFNVFVLRIYESGLNEKWRRDEKMVLMKYLHARPNRNHYVPQTIRDLMWTGYLLSFGYGLSIIIFLAELYLYETRRNRMI
ncbi:hypothetical protein KR067_002788, partial [Drosophila pandora]